MNRQFAISLRDGRVVLCTRETLQNVDYRAISEKVALAIEDGILPRQEVVSKINGKIMTTPSEWDALLAARMSQNMRHTEISAETTERAETALTKDEVKDEFDMPITEGDKPKTAAKRAAKASVKEPLDEELKGL